MFLDFVQSSSCLRRESSSGTRDPTWPESEVRQISEVTAFAASERLLVLGVGDGVSVGPTHTTLRMQTWRCESHVRR